MRLLSCLAVALSAAALAAGLALDEEEEVYSAERVAAVDVSEEKRIKTVAASDRMTSGKLVH